MRKLTLFLLALFLILSLPQSAFADTNTEYEIIPGKIYRVLRAELLSSDGLFISSLNAAKAWLLATEPDRLQLLPYKIVSEEVLNEWSKDRYRPQKEYWEHSPQGLVTCDLQADYSFIPKPYLLDDLTAPEEKSIQIYINNAPVSFGLDKPYLIDDSIVFPELSPWLKHVNINGVKTHFNARPRLSHEKILAPIDLLSFMAKEIRWQELDGIIKLYITL